MVYCILVSKKIAKTYAVAAVALCNAAVDTLKSAKSCAVATNAVAVSCILVANAAVGGAEIAVWWCGCGGFRVWFLYDLVVDAAFGNL